MCILNYSGDACIMEIKFGIQVQQERLSFGEIRGYVKKLEKMGFYSALTIDHLHPVFYSGEEPILENWVLISALASETNKIRLGTLVNCNSFRYPSLLAKMAASLDVISGGRLEFMIGAGWYESEYKGYGIPFLAPKIRLEQMKEAVKIIKLMWTEHKTNFNGKYYNLEGALNYPKPLQKPHPRIWVGGVGDYLLKIVSEVGEGTNFWALTPKVTAEKLDLLKKKCEAIGRDYNSIAKSWSADLAIGSNKVEVEKRLKKIMVKLNNLEVNMGRKERIWSSEELETSRLVGTPSDIINKLEEFIKLGIDYFIVTPPDYRDPSDVKLFKEKVVASFK